MKKNTFYIILFITVTMCSVGCNKFLEKNPDNRADLNTAQNISQLLSTAYPQANYLTMLESASDNAGDRGATSSQISLLVNLQAYWFEPITSPLEDSPEFYWAAAYKAIAAANQALEAITAISNPEALNAQKGEALLCRAYAHFMLTAIFAPVYDPATQNASLAIPYVEKPETILLGKYQRLTVKEVYDKIENDLISGLKLIDNNAYSVPKYHFTTTAAHAFATRFYLFKGVWDKVIEHANAAFPANNFKDALRPWNTDYKEFTANQLLATYTAATETANLLLIETKSDYARNYGRLRYGLTPAIRQRTVTSGNITKGTWAFSTYYQGGDQNNVLLLKYNEYFVKQDVNAEIGEPYMMLPAFTVEEVLLNRAEAYVQAKKYDLALADLNTYASKRIEDYNRATHEITEASVRSYYNPDYAKGILQNVLDFRRNEFMQEGLRYFDILRHKLPIVHSDASDVRTITISPTDPKRTFNYPASALLGFLN